MTASQLCFQPPFPLIHSPRCFQGGFLLWLALPHSIPASVFLPSLPPFNLRPRSSAGQLWPSVRLSAPASSHVVFSCQGELSRQPVLTCLCPGTPSSVKGTLHAILAASPPTSDAFLAHCTKQELKRCFHQKEKQTNECLPLGRQLFVDWINEWILMDLLGWELQYTRLG